MDLVAACRVFVSVSERGSFTQGAAAARVSQSVASRRVAALETYCGERLFDRSTRHAALTPFGRELLPLAKRLAHAADDVEFRIEHITLAPFLIALPDSCAVDDLAQLILAARAENVHLEIERAGPVRRTELARALEVRAAVAPSSASESVWQVPLGLAFATAPPAAVMHLEEFRRIGRSQRLPHRRIWLQPEDDVPQVRDQLTRAAEAAGLLPSQLRLAPVFTAVAEVLDSRDALLCSASEANVLGLAWRQLGGMTLARGYVVAAAFPEDADRVRTLLWPAIARCLGAAHPAEGVLA